ncbi:MAG: response regulator transcription factor [Chloroflexota bacterium]
MPQTILVIDDEKDIRDMVSSYLSQEGYKVVTAVDGLNGLEVAQQEKPNLIILDLMMPGMDGYEFVRTFQRASDTPIIMLTAKIDETDMVLGLELGADDYVTKPFSPRELTARVRSLLRRTGTSASASDIIQIGDVILDLAARRAMINEQPIELTPSEYHILLTLMRNAGRVFSRLELLDDSYEIATDGYERNVDVHIRRLRQKIEANPSKPYWIETVYGFGYRFTRPEK